MSNKRKNSTRRNRACTHKTTKRKSTLLSHSSRVKHAKPDYVHCKESASAFFARIAKLLLFSFGNNYAITQREYSSFRKIAINRFVDLIFEIPGAFIAVIGGIGTAYYAFLSWSWPLAREKLLIINEKYLNSSIQITYLPDASLASAVVLSLSSVAFFLFLFISSAVITKRFRQTLENKDSLKSSTKNGFFFVNKCMVCIIACSLIAALIEIISKNEISPATAYALIIISLSLCMGIIHLLCLVPNLKKCLSSLTKTLIRGLAAFSLFYTPLHIFSLDQAANQILFLLFTFSFVFNLIWMILFGIQYLGVFISVNSKSYPNKDSSYKTSSIQKPLRLWIRNTLLSWLLLFLIILVLFAVFIYCFIGFYTNLAALIFNVIDIVFG